MGAARGPIFGIGTPEGRRLPFFSALRRVEPGSGHAASRDFGLDLPGEPILAGRDGRWLLALLHRTEAPTQLLVLDAADLTTRAVATLPQAVPPGFHGCWVTRKAMPEPDDAI